MTTPSRSTSWLRSFLDLNRKLSARLRTERPGLFGEHSPMDHYHLVLARILEARRRKGRFSVLEVGGIDRPLLRKSPDYSYDGLDIEHKATCLTVYDRFWVRSIEQRLPRTYDLIISKALLEHVPNNAESFKTIYSGLTEGGETLHFVPCKNHPYSICTRIVGHRLQRFLIGYLRPGRLPFTGYKTHYDLCTKKDAEQTLRRLGFGEIRTRCFWEATDYFAFFVPAFVAISLFNRVCEMLNLTFFASGMVLYARKGGSSSFTDDAASGGIPRSGFRASPAKRGPRVRNAGH